MNQEIILKEISGVFDGRAMVVSEGCSISVPENYASKSMMLAGTELVYRITDKSSYFKQTYIPPARTAIGKIIWVEDGLRAEINDNGFIHRMLFLHAFTTFYRLKPGDEVVVAFPENLSLMADNYCAIENRI